MQLVFHDRSVAPVLPSGESFLTVERGGNFALTVAAVEALRLQPDSQVLLAQDLDTNTWYLVLGEVAGKQTFTLRPRDRKGKALQFCSQPRSRAYFEGHGLDRATTRSVRAAVGLEPVQHEQLVLYPLRPQHATRAPAPVEAVAPAAETAPKTAENVHEAPESVAETAENVSAAPESVPATEPAPPAAPIAEQVAPARAASLYTADMDEALLAGAEPVSRLSQAWEIPTASLYARRSYLKKKAADVATAAAPAPAPPPAPTLVYTPAPAEGSGEPIKKTYGLQARAEELTAHWMERDIVRTTPGELAEILNLLRHVPASKRGIELELVLGRAEVEQTHRQTAAGKGGARG